MERHNNKPKKLHFSFSVNLPALTLKEKCYTIIIQLFCMFSHCIIIIHVHLHYYHTVCNYCRDKNHHKKLHFSFSVNLPTLTLAKREMLHYSFSACPLTYYTLYFIITQFASTTYKNHQ